MQSLSTVQKMFRVLKVLTIIVFVFKIVGAAMSLIGGIGLLAFGSLGAKFSAAAADRFYGGILFGGAGVYGGSAVVCFVTAMLLACGAVCTQFLIQYFKHEGYDGTPFTFHGAKRLRKVGIIYIAVQSGALFVVMIICALFGTTGMIHFGISTIGSNIAPISSGIVMILLSFIFKHGAELAASYQSPPTNDQF